MKTRSILTLCFPLFALAITQSGCFSKSQKGIFRRKNIEIERDLGSASSKNPKRITILATNDIHGGIEEKKTSPEGPVGGMAFFSGVVQAIRTGLEHKYGADAGVLVLDAGDQFQGTLISNITEGNLVFSIMNKVGYDAAVPGNHDYDFGPHGWLEDKVTPESKDTNPRGVITSLTEEAQFPLLAANVFLKGTSKRLDIFKPYLIKDVAGVRVALIGLDNPQTPTITTPENVSDLFFKEELQTYREIRQELEGKADLFVLILHNGDANNESHVSQLVKEISTQPNQVHAVVSGHTHFVVNKNSSGVPIVQSGANGEMFGRIDLVWNPESRTVEKNPKSVAGIKLYHQKCDQKAPFCSMQGGQVFYEGVQAKADTEIQSMINQVRAQIAPLAERKLGLAENALTINRTSESSLANILTDSFRLMTQADIAFLNTGGLRASIPAGEVTYEELFRVLPFNNHAVIAGPMPWKQIFGLLSRSVQTCGSFGALMQSGLKVEFTRNCETAGRGVDKSAHVLTVRTLDNKVLYDLEHGINTPPETVFKVATLDFLIAGGSGFKDFLGVPILNDCGIFRETLTEQLFAHPASWSGKTDHRWVQR